MARADSAAARARVVSSTRGAEDFAGRRGGEESGDEEPSPSPSPSVAAGDSGLSPSPPPPSRDISSGPSLSSSPSV